jgi:lipopolysaccharide biosynthesis glycosyltransferase
MIPIFIGYDPKESIAFHICVNSIIQNTKQPVNIIPLSLSLLNDYKEIHSDSSNDFTYSRFLVPYLMKFENWAIFLDGDMIIKEDISNLWNYKDETKDVMVVKHDYTTKSNAKYLSNKNEDYPRKNWSSVMIFNCQNYPTRKLTPEYIEKSTGAHLHRFQWTSDDRVGALPAEWNWLPDEYGANSDAKLLHYTLGTPCFHEFATTTMADEWHRERMLTNYSLQK